MTLTAFVCRPDEVEIVTDTLAYYPMSVILLRQAKVRHFPLVDAAVHTRGVSLLGMWWEADRERACLYDDGFDAWHEHAQQRLPDLWTSYKDTERQQAVFDDGARAAGRVFHFGWSQSRGRFVVLEYHSDDGFTGRDLTDHDGIWSWAPGRHPVPAPTSDQEWIDYIEMVREERADPMVCATEGAWLIGGDLWHTRLRRGEALTRRIHTYPEDWTWRRQFIGSLHPHGQLGPCVCGSGQPARHCHLATVDATQPCMCGSGKPLVDCHLLDPVSPDAYTYWREHLDDFDRDRDALSAAWKATQPDDLPREPADVIGMVRRSLSTGDQAETVARVEG